MSILEKTTTYLQPSLFDFLNNKNYTLNIATMCSGIGTPEIALNELGVKSNIVFACEIDEFARETYRANHTINPEDFKNDIASFDASPYVDKIDILIFGSPCQPFSIAGYRKGFDDPRGQVFFEGMKRISECKPKIVIFENVPGLLSHDDGKTYEIVKDEFTKLGYRFRAQLLNSKEYNGLQNRERLYLIAFRDDITLNDFDMDSFEIKTTDMFFSDILENEVDEKYWLSPTAKDYMFADYKDTKRIKKGKVLKSRHEHLSTNFSSNKFAYTITASYAKGYPHNVLVVEDACKYGFWSCDFVCTGMCEHCDIDNELNFQDSNLATPAYRRMTPRECARTQGIPDSFLFTVSDSQAYKQIGNSMEINIIKEVFMKVIDILKLQNLGE